MSSVRRRSSPPVTFSTLASANGIAGVTTKQESVIPGTWFVETVAPFMQTEGLPKIAGKTRYGVGIELAGYP